MVSTAQFLDDLDIPPFAPVRQSRPRHNGWTAQRQRLFIAALMQTGMVADAARAVGMSRNSAYTLRRHADAASFAAAWDLALEMGLETALETAMKRALHAETVPVFYHGRQVGTRTRHDNRLLMRVLNLLSRRDQAMATRRRSGAAGPVGGNGSATFAP